MELPIKHKRGTTIPTAGDLVVGEIAINTATGLCYTKTGAGNVVAIGLDVAANWGNIGGTLSSQTDLSNALALKADLSGASFSGTVYAPVVRNLLNTDLVIDSYNDTGAGTHYLHKFTPFDGKFVLAPNGGGLTFPDASVQTTAAVTPDLSGYALLASPALSGNPTSPTPSTSDNDTSIATTAFVKNQAYLTSSSLSGYALLSGATFTGKVNTTTTATTPSLNLGGAISSGPTSATNGDIWITNAASPKFAYRTGGVNYYPAVANQFNTFSAGVAITSNSTSPQLTITQLGTGHALVVEDKSSPDTSSFIVNNDGFVGIAQNPATWSPTQKLEIDGYATSTTAPFSDQSTKLATTANVKASICGSVTSVPSSGWQVSYSAGYPNQIIRVYNDSTSGAMSVPSETHIPVGTRYTFIQTETLPFYFMAEGGGASVFSFENKFTSAGEYAICNLIKTAHHEWFLTGDLVATLPYGTFISSQCVMDMYNAPGGPVYGDFGYEVTRANGSGGTYSTIEGSNTGGCYHPSGTTYYSNMMDIYWPGPYGDVNVGTSNYGEYADGNGGTYTDSSNSYSAGCGGTYASLPGTDGATGIPMTTHWKIDCANDTYYTENILNAGYVLSQGCTSINSIDAMSVSWSVPVLQKQITDGAGGYYYENESNYNSYPDYCGWTPSGYAINYSLTGSDPYIYYLQGNSGVWDYYYYAYNWSADFADGTGSSYTSTGTTNYQGAGYIFYQFYDDAGARNVFYHFDGVNGYYETNDGT